jgi:6-phosphogluconolactonase (cycloisomerase 2 family)
MRLGRWLPLAALILAACGDGPKSSAPLATATPPSSGTPQPIAAWTAPPDVGESLPCRADGSRTFAYAAKAEYDLSDPLLYVYRMNEESGCLAAQDGMPIEWRSHLAAADPDGRFLFDAECAGHKACLIRSYEIGPEGRLTLRASEVEQQEDTRLFGHPLRLVATHQHVYVHFDDSSTGTVSGVWGIAVGGEDGRLRSLGAFAWSGEGGSSHAIALSPDRGRLYQSGGDGLRVHAIAEDGRLNLLGRTQDTPQAALDLKVHPSGTLAYALFGDISTYQVDAAGKPRRIGGVAMTGAPTVGSRLAMDPLGRFLFVTTTLGVEAFAIDTASGHLEPRGVASSGAADGRMAITPSGRFLYVSSTSGMIWAYRIDESTGSTRVIGRVGKGGGDLAIVAR